MYLYFEQLKWDWKYKGIKVKHLAGKNHYFYTTQIRWLEFKFKNVWLTSHANLATFLSYLEDWIDDDGITLSVKRDASNYISCDGNNTSWVVVPSEGGIRDIEKLSVDDQDGPYQIGFLHLIQAG